jgi:nucleoid-associated protein YgaU
VLEGEVDRLDLRLPREVEVVKVEGDAVLQWRTEVGGRLIILLRYLVEDKARLAVRFQFPTTPGDPVDLRMPLALKNVPLDGALGVQGPAGLDIKETKKENAKPLNARDLPNTLTNLTASPLLFGYSFSKEPTVQLSVSRHQEVELTNTLIDQLEASTLVIEDGTEITKLKIRMRNNTEQYLTMHLPKDAVLTHSLIDGQPYRPAIANQSNKEALMFPLRQSERIGSSGQRYHTVQAGETLSEIANLYYANPSRWRYLLDHNSDQMQYAEDMAVGQRLLIPTMNGVAVEESAFVIELAYKRKQEPLGDLGNMELTLPKIDDIETVKVVWHLYFPDVLVPLCFDANLTQYSHIRYDPFRRIGNILTGALVTRRARAGDGGKYESILLKRKSIYHTEADQRGKEETILSNFPLTGERYRFKRTLLGKDTPKIKVSYLSKTAVVPLRIGALVLAFFLCFMLTLPGRNMKRWVAAGSGLVLLLVVGYYILGVNRRILWGIDLALLVALLRSSLKPAWNNFIEIVYSPWRVIRLLTFRNFLFLLGLSFVLCVILWFPLLFSTLAGLLFFFWRMREISKAQKEVAHV